MNLTPDQIEGFIEKWRGCPYIDIGVLDAVFGEYGPQDILDTFEAYVSIVRRVAENPGQGTRLTGCGGTVQECSYCGGMGMRSTYYARDVAMSDESYWHVDHTPDCLYLAARKLRGLEGSG